MAQDVQLEIQGDGTNFTFDVEGTWHIRPLEFFYKTAAHPPELTAIRETLEVTGARVVGATPEAFWDAWQSFVGRLLRRGDQGGFPTYVRIRRLVGTGAPITEYVLGSNHGNGNFTDMQGFTIETLETRQDELLKGATWRRSIVIDIRFSAVRVFPDSNGIVGWQQEVSNSYDAAGLHTLEWRTTITTREGGDDPRDLAAVHAKIPRSNYGTNYVWATNGPDGIDWETDDADEVNARTPTRLVAVSRIRQVGIDVGSTDAGAAPGDVEFSQEVVTEGAVTTTTTRAAATGPNAAAFVRSKRPVGDIDRSRSFEEFAALKAEGEWVQIKASAQGGDSDSDAEKVAWEIGVKISGGDQGFEFVPMSCPFIPELAIGAFLPVEVTVTVASTLVAASAKPQDMPFPAVLPQPLILDREASEEDRMPRRTKIGTRRSQDTWERTARLVYRAAVRPAQAAFDGLYAKPSVRSYFE